VLDLFARLSHEGACVGVAVTITPNLVPNVCLTGEYEVSPRSFFLSHVVPSEACGRGGASEAAKNQKPIAAVEAKSNRQREIPAESPGLGYGGVVEVKTKNHRLWAALSRDEIEEDVFSMMGTGRLSRPRKRTKTLQKYLDVIFPGLCLVRMNADCFRVSTSRAKIFLTI
ncbi:uncharacterized protein LOC130507106, partial [Raphanus sativus]|uniref:Uncharacterized protein LOC130507106 n=1 Tax=Raphanus sativus TaxID=3726 RepID=A0A9W3D1Z2_RAPSA